MNHRFGSSFKRLCCNLYSVRIITLAHTCLNNAEAQHLSEKLRVFLSVHITDEPLLARISNIQRRLDQEAAKLKLVEKENIHFTFRFFGDTSLSRIEEMRKTLETVSIDPFTISIAGVGAFPSSHRPNVIWVGVNQNAERMAELKTKIDVLLANLGYPPEKNFKAHATIARVRALRNRERLLNNLELLAREAVGTMTVSAFQMTKSTLKPSGPVYETLWEIPSRKPD
ncbi:MAG: RNA 2',3'-cyclic phosphodiesterase [Candidatus Thorarchaeota archaeon]|nr:MAG: RNA 2',3'-cyclic phosphodiesterase [Candidatus Thorarchaeota archaeon]